MRVLNFYGTTSCLVPTLNASLPFVEVNSDYANNNIYFFKGEIPDADTLNGIVSQTSLLTTYADVLMGQVTAFTLHYSQNNTKLQRIIKKDPDVLEMPYLADGTITWFALCLNEGTPEAGKTPIIFSDSIGIHEDDGKFVTIETFTGTTGTMNLFRELSLILTEISNLEGI